MKKKRESVGSLSQQIAKKAPDTRDPIELEREMHKDYVDELFACVNQHKAGYHSDFFVVVLTKKERLMSNVIRNLFFARATCPTPEFDQVVYRYHKDHEALEFLWVIPSKDTCELFKQCCLEIAPEERELLKFVLDYYDGNLLRLAKQLNGERAESPLLQA